LHRRSSRADQGGRARPPAELTRHPYLMIGMQVASIQAMRTDKVKADGSNINMKHEELTHRIIGCAYQVCNQLGFGFLESVYKKAMVIELINNDLSVEEDKALKVYYNDQVIGDFYADLYIEDEIIVELKSVQNIIKEHEVQLVNYLNVLKKEIGTFNKFWPFRCGN